MISLIDAAKVFNKTVFTDINGLNSFSAQILPFNDNTRSGVTSRRRIMEVASYVTVPDVVIQEATNEVFLTASHSVDFFRAEVIRSKVPIIPADEQYAVKSVEEMLNASVGIVEWGSLNYTRREVLDDSSDYLGGYAIILPAHVTIKAGQYLINGANYYRSRADSRTDELGFTVVELVELPNAIQTLDIVVKGVYDPVTETSSDVTTSVNCVVEERSKSYERTRMDAVKLADGDFTVNTLHDCNVGDLVGEFDIIHKRVEGNVKVLHCRRP